MLELTAAKKNKIHLPDYPFRKDIENRILLSDFSLVDLNVLEELLFSSLKTSSKKLSRSLNLSEDLLDPILKRIASTGLLSEQDGMILIDKEMRKYFETEISRFHPDFKPDFEFLQQIFHKVPIEYLPNWYAIPRTSNNIFSSIVEKYLFTPQIFQRHLMEVQLGDPIATAIMVDLFKTPDYKLLSSDVIAKYNLTQTDFHRLLLLLEFNFIACVSYQQEEDHWVEIITPFHEWRQYLLFLKETETPIISSQNRVQQIHSEDFAVIQEMTRVVAASQKTPLKEISPLVQKLLLLELLQSKDHTYFASEMGQQWLQMEAQNKAIYIYRHPMNRILSTATDCQNNFEKVIREAEKAIKRVLHGRWVLFDDFFKGVLAPLGVNCPVELKKLGRHWRYTIPVYTEKDKEFMKAVIHEWLFEMGIVSLGTFEGKDCFRVTDFGRSFFEA